MINGTTLHYEIDGNGPPCLVLHGGLGLDHNLYRRTLNRLAATRQLVFYDHRCNGRSGRPPLDTLTMEQLADDAVALADHLGAERFTVLGHSYGGFVAQELALRYPDRLDRLVLVSTTPGQLGTDEDPRAYEGPLPPPEFVEAISSPPASDEEYAATMLHLLPYYLHRLSADVVAPFLDGTVFDAAAMRRGFEVLDEWSSVDRLGRIAVPVLLLVGRHDLFTACQQSYRIADRLPDAEVVVLEGSGHLPWVEEPDAFFDTVERWLAE